MADLIHEVADPCKQEVLRCHQCNLPIGEKCFELEKGGHVHNECIPQLLRKDLQAQHEVHMEKQQASKKSLKAEFDIGWNFHRVPQNTKLVKQLHHEGSAPLQGLCCLVLHKDVCNGGTKTISLAPTNEPAAAVNIEYLLLALRVRLKSGTEPFFSLDPLTSDGQNIDMEFAMQEKRFEPDWLAGTSVGEVLFQADYHLKELSMGEATQPVMGMQSCLDIAEAAGEFTEQWVARTWFVVRHAAMHISEDNVLVPAVRMGVEAREMAKSTSGRWEDAPITRFDHPLVQYAESFSQYFNLIAERRSCIFHLRELAKASVLAKYLLDARIGIKESWLLAADLASASALPCCMEVPQLWNEKCEGQVVSSSGATPHKILPSARGVYGGVSFGLQRFPLSGGLVAARPRSTAAARALRSFADSVTERAAAVPGLTTGRRPRVGVAVPGMLVEPDSRLVALLGLQGVRPAAPGPGAGRDRHFTARVPRAPPVGVYPMPSLRISAPLAIVGARMPRPALIPPKARRAAAPPPLPAPTTAAWASALRAAAPMGAIGAFAYRAPSLGVRAPSISDTVLSMRPGFTPMRVGLLQTTATTTPIPPAPQRVVKGVDLSLDTFSLSSPALAPAELWGRKLQSESGSAPLGELFWSLVDSDAKTGTRGEPHANLWARVFNPLLSDRRTEGDRFIPPETSTGYVQELRCLVTEEERSSEGLDTLINTVPSGDAYGKPDACPDNHVALLSDSGIPIKDSSLVVRMREYVEHGKDGSRNPNVDHHYFLVLEVEDGALIVTEALPDGTASWLSQPSKLDARTSQARLTCSLHCEAASLFVRDVKRFHLQEAKRMMGHSADGKDYTRNFIAYGRSQ